MLFRSTGRPKGVSVEHGQLFNYVKGVTERLELAECRSFATVSTFAADLGHTAIFPALCGGAALHVICSEMLSDGDALGEYFQTNEIDCLKIVPSHMSSLLSCSNPAALIPRKRLIFGGEASGWDLVQQIHSLAPNCRLFNHYGPTETTVGVLTYPVDPQRPSQYSSTVPIGKPLPNSTAFILDSTGSPVPIGVAGELYIGGRGLARGYFNKLEQTNARFAAASLPEAGQQRLYRTGDMVRHLPDGNIEFLGRVDNQVKIRGFRIEPGEIEAALAEHPGVSESVVIAHGETAGDKTLIAYVVANHACPSTISDWKDHLHGTLPEFMVPSRFIALASLPLTSNGKIDRRALPDPNTVEAEPGALYVEPRTNLELVLADIWAEVLGVDQVGVYGNFFDLGGHSLKATQVISRIRKTLHIEAGMRDIFVEPTVAGFARSIEGDVNRRQTAERAAEVYAKLARLSDEEVEAMLAERALAGAE